MAVGTVTSLSTLEHRMGVSRPSKWEHKCKPRSNKDPILERISAMIQDQSNRKPKSWEFNCREMGRRSKRNFEKELIVLPVAYPSLIQRLFHLKFWLVTSSVLLKPPFC